MPVGQQLKYWGIAALVLFLSLWWLGQVMLPFILAGALAYLLDPVADRLQRLGLSRILATGTIALAGILLFVLAVLLVIPTLIEQAGALINAAPDLIDGFLQWLTTQFPEVLGSESTVREQLTKIGEAIQTRGGELMQGVVTSAMSVLNILFLLVIVPVVAFYLLLDWDRMIERIDELLPRDHAPVIRMLARDIDITLSSFIRGQFLVCLILGTFYGVALMLAELNYGLVIGFVAGMISFIPYVGSLVGGAMAIGLAFFQFWGDWTSIGLIVGIFAFGQFVEGNILSPNLVGNSVGLHPVWLIFALSVFGSLFGFVGMLVAVPVAAMIGVVIRFLTGRYKEGLLYRGKTVAAPSDAVPLGIEDAGPVTRADPSE